MDFFYKDMNFVWSAWDRRMISFGNLIGGKLFSQNSYPGNLW